VRELAVFSNKDSDKKVRVGFFARHFGAAKDQRPTASQHSSMETVQKFADASSRAGASVSHISYDDLPPIFTSEPIVNREAAATSEIHTDGHTSDSPAFDGLTLEDFCLAHQLTTAEVWRQLRSGELTGRTEKGRLLIYSEANALRTADGLIDMRADDDLKASDLPPIPGSSAEDGGAFLTLTGQRNSTPELAMLIDHLSLAKEENREILRMAQDSIKKVTEMSDSIVEMKEAVIEAKDMQLHAREQELKAVKEQCEEQARQLRRLRQQNEDLEMLTRTLTKDQ
jgi:hypothetical protein